jgi:hypothetical protein
MSVRLPLLAAAVAFGVAPLSAQTGLATLTGTITDQSSAVIPNAVVRARHVDTGATLTGTASATGYYLIAQMPIGRYEVSVEQAGFKTFRRAGMALGAAQILRLDVTLEVGAATESVTVSAEASMLNLDSGALVHTVTPEQLQELPLLPVGGFIRDPFALALTIPGTQNFTAGFGYFTPRVNGLPSTSIQYRLEGEVLGQLGASLINTRTQPSVDAIQEVAIQTSNFSAEFGSVGGALFNVTLKSGNNRYRGTVYDYAVNEILNANDPSVHRRNQERRHDWGFNFGGPIQVPKLYDGHNRTFFFFNLEQYRNAVIQRVQTGLPTVPIPEYREGDFSRLITASGNSNLRIGAGAAARDYIDPLGGRVLAGTVFDPNSTRQVVCDAAISPDCGGTGNLVNYRTPFPGNKVPASYFDPVALAIQNKYIPLPQGANAANGVLVNNYDNPFTSRRLSNIPSLKIDHSLNQNARLSFTWQLTKTTSPIQAIGGAEGLPSPITQNRGTYESAPNLRLNYDHTLKPYLILHVGAGWSQFEFSDAALETNYNPAADIGLRGARLDRNFPTIASSVVTFPALGGMNAMGPTGQASTPERRPSGTVSLTWVKNNHAVKFGADFRQDMLPRLTFTNTAGNFGGFTGNGITWQPALQGITGLTGNSNTGFGYANFLMGSVRSLSLSVPIAYRTSKQQWGMYLQDTWRATRKLTIDYGLRWDYGTYTKEDYGRNAGLSLTEPNPSAGGRRGALIYEATCTCQFAHNYPYGVGPRLGLAYRLNNRTVVRGGFGIAYNSTGSFSGFAANSASVPTPQAGEDIFKLRDGIPGSVNPQWPSFDPALGHPNGAVIGARQLLDSNAGRPSRTYQWNFSVQREVLRNLVVEASYVGNRGRWLDAAGLVDFNAVSEQLLAHYGFTVGNLDDATLLNQRWNLLTPAQRATLAARGVGLPYSSFPVSGVTAQTVFQSLRPYPQYSTGISPTSAPLGKSWYDAFQLTINKRYSNGLQVNANYTWAKNLAHNSAPDIFNRANGKDINGFTPPQQFRVSFLYQLPRPASQIPVIGNRWVSQAIGGWGVAMALFYESGSILGRPAAGSVNGINRWLGRGPGGAQLKKDADGNYMNPWSVNWVDIHGNRRTDPLDINCKCFDPEKTIVLNPAVWETVPDATWAAQTQVLPFFRGPRRPTESGNLSRTFRFGKENKYSLQVRVEFQNVFNRLLLPNPSSFGNFNTTPTLSGDGRYIAGFGTFGNLRNANAYGAERSGVFIARFLF